MSADFSGDCCGFALPETNANAFRSHALFIGAWHNAYPRGFRSGFAFSFGRCCWLRACNPRYAGLGAPNADAALDIAIADVTGRTKRESIVKANPFLERFTIADIKSWADRKMRIRPCLGSPKSLAPTPL